MPNLFAYTMLYIWPVIMIVFFKKMALDRALIWSFLGAFMFLPSGVVVDLPLIPVLDKFTIPSLVALILCWTLVKQKIQILPPSTIVSVLMIGFVLSPFATVLSNLAPAVYGVVFLPGLQMKDAISAALANAITLIPFILAFNFLSTTQARSNFLTAYMIAGLIYSIPMLLEVRLSPQFSYWVYGYFVELFDQQLRFGGYRPVVFMGHGLTAAFFLMITTLSSAILWQSSNSKTHTLYAFAVLYLLIVLILCKTVGPLLFAALFLPIILSPSLKIKAFAIVISALLILTYPVLRSNDAIPTERLLSYASLIQDERARSLEFRFDNEEMLLDHANQKPYFGWGSWNRNRVFDPESGRDVTVTDGYWIIVMGVYGWTGYLCVFGLLTLPLFRLCWRRRNAALNEHYMAFGAALLLAINLLELIPNATINTMTWLLAGLLLACSFQTVEAENEETAAVKEIDSTSKPLQHKRQPRGQRPHGHNSPGQFHRKKRTEGRVKR